MATVTIAAQPREGRKKGAARRLRADGHIPAVLYGLGRDPSHISFDVRDFRKAISTKSGTRAVMKLQMAGTDEQVAILRDIQRHPLSRDIIHVDLLAIDLNEPIEVAVPVAPLGTPTGVKDEGGVLGWARRELNIRVLPTQIPEAIEIDISGLHINDAIHVEDIEAEGFELLDEPERTICSVASQTLGEDIPEPEEEGEEGEEGEEAAAEGEGEEGEGEDDGESGSEEDKKDSE